MSRTETACLRGHGHGVSQELTPGPEPVGGALVSVVVAVFDKGAWERSKPGRVQGQEKCAA